MNVTATLFGQMITFVIFVWFIKVYLWEPLTKAMEARANKIADGLASAELGEKKIKDAEEHYKNQVEEAKNKASEIIGGAEQQSKNIIDTARHIAKEEAAKTYATRRAEEYPAIVAQLDDIFHNGIDGWKATIQVTKDKYPKE